MSGTRSSSLAGRLTRALIVWVGGVWLLCVFGVVWYVDREINYNFDSELVEVAHRMFDIAVDAIERRAPERVDGRPLLAPTPSFPDAAVLFQLADAGGRVLLRSAETRGDEFDVPLAPGFANNVAWRIYTVHDRRRNLYLQVADPLDERRAALNRTLFGLMIPLGAMLPLLAWLLRRIARRELKVLQQLSSEIARRSGTDLSAIALPGLPHELQSVGDHVNRLLQRLSQSLDIERALASNAAHELRTPLAAARLRLQTALEHDLRRDEVEAALAALKMLSQRTEKLLQLSRAESAASLTRNPVDLTRLAATVAQEFWQEARTLGRLDLKLPGSDDAEAAMDAEAAANKGQLPATQAMTLGDFDALAIALRNLVENALHYARDSRVEIEVGPACELVVRDFGPGVSDVELRTLQLRHVRHSAERAGYGLGLSIVATIVAKHDGRLELHSPPPGAAHGFEARIVLRPADAG
ncbi:MAG: sensor histidine kinase [Comamonadaceae bacterium]|nr:MAG: sensor histidine kinase [Comamonadaceae bacterium]